MAGVPGCRHLLWAGNHPECFVSVTPFVRWAALPPPSCSWVSGTESHSGPGDVPREVTRPVPAGRPPESVRVGPQAQRRCPRGPVGGVSGVLSEGLGPVFGG